MTSNNDRPTDHEYDGIKELDNFLPQWWVLLFLFCVLFAGAYYAYYELGDGPGLNEELKVEMAAHQQKVAAGKPADSGGGFPDEQKLNAFFADSKKLSDGKAVFMTRCASCHGPAGGGSIGPNLTDKHWINGDGSIVAIAKVINEGVGAKGMPPWGPVLSSDEMYTVAAFVKSLKGTNPAGGKAPQGTEYP
jgi:cytochrome c oxidase cbb3-type subunit 3